MILKPITTITLPAIKKFVAKDYFKLDKTPDGVKIDHLGNDFKKHFLNKIEIDIPKTEITVAELIEEARDKEIIAELGGQEETTLAHFWELLKKQPKGEDGVLKTNWRSNIFYIRDIEGALWAVNGDWSSDFAFWYVFAYPVSDPFKWSRGRQFFSRASLKPSEQKTLGSSDTLAVRYVLSSQDFATVEDAQIKMDKYQVRGKLNADTRIYEVSAVYKPKLERVEFRETK